MKLVFFWYFSLEIDSQRHSVWCWKCRNHRQAYKWKALAMNWCVISWLSQQRVAFDWRVVLMNQSLHHYQLWSINIQSHHSLYHANWLFRIVIYKILNTIRRHSNSWWHKVPLAMYSFYSHAIRNHWLGQRPFEKQYHCYTHENRCQNQRKSISKSHNRESHWLITHVNYSSGKNYSDSCFLLCLFWKCKMQFSSFFFK